MCVSEFADVDVEAVKEAEAEAEGVVAVEVKVEALSRANVLPLAEALAVARAPLVSSTLTLASRSVMSSGFPTQAHGQGAFNYHSPATRHPRTNSSYMSYNLVFKFSTQCCKD